MNNWLPYPKYKPTDINTDINIDNIVLVPNPRYVHKSVYQQNISKYIPVLAFWLVDRFHVAEGAPCLLDVKYFIKLPPLPD